MDILCSIMPPCLLTVHCQTPLLKTVTDICGALTIAVKRSKKPRKSKVVDRLMVTGEVILVDEPVSPHFG